MNGYCYKCSSPPEKWSKFGRFYRKADKTWVQRYTCLICKAHFSKSSFHHCYRQKKRTINKKVLELLVSGVSQRRSAALLKINRKTIVRKLIYWGERARFENFHDFYKLPDIKHIQFDDLETLEHTKCKPLSVTMAVEHPSRKILGFSVSSMPVKGHLTKVAIKKYGPRQDTRSFGRRELFIKLQTKIGTHALFESDDNPHYRTDLKKHFPLAVHKTYLGQRGALTGQGELKNISFDPLFSLNHTFAMLRANINRLFRKTWCTTKRPDRLEAHLEAYVYYHNRYLTKVA